jgi:hypothetical protein
VVEKIVQENKLSEFIAGWRRNFVETMDPKHLPPHWSIDHESSTEEEDEEEEEPEDD